MQEKQKNPGGKQLKIVLLVLFALILSAIIVFLYSQKDNLKALSYASRYSQEELAQKEQAVNAKLQEIVEKLPDVQVNQLTEEEQKKLENGEISAEEALSIISGAPQEDKQSRGDAKPQTSSVNAIIAKFYLLKAEYLNSINGLIAQGKSEWRSLPKKERTLTAKLNMANKYLGMGSSLEGACDGRMQQLLAELESELVATGQNTAIIGEITALYNEEKAVKKAALIDAYYPKI